MQLNKTMFFDQMLGSSLHQRGADYCGRKTAGKVNYLQKFK